MCNSAHCSANYACFLAQSMWKHMTAVSALRRWWGVLGFYLRYLRHNLPSRPGFIKRTQSSACLKAKKVPKCLDGVTDNVLGQFQKRIQPLNTCSPYPHSVQYHNKGAGLMQSHPCCKIHLKA